MLHAVYLRILKSLVGLPTKLKGGWDSGGLGLDSRFTKHLFSFNWHGCSC